MNAPVPAREQAELAQKLASDPLVSAWVGASAGSGKTKVLTDRVLALLLAGSEPERILCLTFTKAAAAEMAIRLGKTLSDWVVLDDSDLRADIEKLTGAEADAAVLERARQLFARVLDAPGGLRIETIHAFCQSLLRRFPLEAGIPPHFQVMEERSAAEAMEQARSHVLDRARDSRSKALRQSLDRVTQLTDADGFAQLL
jgi:ATP-dependent helicase/nuclease subunit A